MERFKIYLHKGPTGVVNDLLNAGESFENKRKESNPKAETKVEITRQTWIGYFIAEAEEEDT